MDEQQRVIAACDLAERIVDEASRDKQDWVLIGRLAGTLAEIAAQACADSPARASTLKDPEATAATAASRGRRRAGHRRLE